MAAGSLPDLILMEDANDLVDFLEFAGRTVPRHKWSVESIAASQRAALEGMF